MALVGGRSGTGLGKEGTGMDCSTLELAFASRVDLVAGMGSHLGINDHSGMDFQAGARLRPGVGWICTQGWVCVQG